MSLASHTLLEKWTHSAGNQRNFVLVINGQQSDGDAHYIKAVYFLIANSYSQ